MREMGLNGLKTTVVLILQEQTQHDMHEIELCQFNKYLQSLLIFSGFHQH